MLLTGLSALEQTDWTRLHHAYGRATDTPGHLRALLEEDAAGRKAAMEHLWSAIIHQGTPWTATGPVALVVAGLLLDERIDRGPEPIRANLMSFLVEVAETFNRTGMTIEELERMAAAANIGPLIDAGYDDEALWEEEETVNAFYARSVLECVAAAPVITDAMLAGLDHADAPVRVRAAIGAASLAMSTMRDRAPEIESRLTAMIRASSDSDERSALVLALGQLRSDAVLESLSDPSRAVRVCAALAPGLRGHPAATAALLDAFNHHVTEIDGWFTNRPPQFFGYPRFEVVARLVESVKDFDRLVPGALALLPIADKRTVDRDWGPLLAAAFPAGDGIVKTPAQRQFLQALVDQRKLWDPVYGNPLQWFRKAGLTYDRKACARIAAP